MKKRFTGRKIDSKEFKKMNKCVECGYADNMKKGERCENCAKLNRPKCYYCEGILKEENVYYSYDNHDNLRHTESLKLSKKPIKEFLIHDKSYTKPYTENLCESCHAMQEEIRKNYRKIKCACGCKLIPKMDKDNLVEYIRVNGKYCQECIIMNEIVSDLTE